MEEIEYRASLRELLNSVTDLNEGLLERVKQLKTYINRAGLEVPPPEAGFLAPIVAIEEPGHNLPLKRRRTGEASSSYAHPSAQSLHMTVLERDPKNTGIAEQSNEILQGSHAENDEPSFRQGSSKASSDNLHGAVYKESESRHELELPSREESYEEHADSPEESDTPRDDFPADRSYANETEAFEEVSSVRYPPPDPEPEVPRVQRGVLSIEDKQGGALEESREEWHHRASSVEDVRQQHHSANEYQASSQEQEDDYEEEEIFLPEAEDDEYHGAHSLSAIPEQSSSPAKNSQISELQTGTGSQALQPTESASSQLRHSVEANLTAPPGSISPSFQRFSNAPTRGVLNLAEDHEHRAPRLSEPLMRPSAIPRRTRNLEPQKLTTLSDLQAASAAEGSKIKNREETLRSHDRSSQSPSKETRDLDSGNESRIRSAFRTEKNHTDHEFSQGSPQRSSPSNTRDVQLGEVPRSSKDPGSYDGDFSRYNEQKQDVAQSDSPMQEPMPSAKSTQQPVQIHSNPTHANPSQVSKGQESFIEKESSQSQKGSTATEIIESSERPRLTNSIQENERIIQMQLKAAGRPDTNFFQHLKPPAALMRSLDRIPSSLGNHLGSGSPSSDRTPLSSVDASVSQSQIDVSMGRLPNGRLPTRYSRGTNEHPRNANTKWESQQSAVPQIMQKPFQSTPSRQRNGGMQEDNENPVLRSPTGNSPRLANPAGSSRNIERSSGNLPEESTGEFASAVSSFNNSRGSIPSRVETSGNGRTSRVVAESQAPSYPRTDMSSTPRHPTGPLDIGSKRLSTRDPTSRTPHFPKHTQDSLLRPKSGPTIPPPVRPANPVNASSQSNTPAPISSISRPDENGQKKRRRMKSRPVYDVNNVDDTLPERSYVRLNPGEDPN